MAEDFAELGLTGLPHAAGKFIEKGYDVYHGRRQQRKNMNGYGARSGNRRSPQPRDDYDSEDSDDSYDDRRAHKPRRDQEAYRYPPQPQDYRPRTRDEPRYSSQQQQQSQQRGYNNAQPSAGRNYQGAGGQGNAMQPYDRRQDRDRGSDRGDRDRDRDRGSDRGDRDRDRGRDRDRDRDRDSNRSRSRKSKKGNDEEYPSDSPMLAFDRSEIGLGAALAGALVGGFIGREAGDHKKRMAIAGALIGGVGGNLLEHRYKIYREDKEDEKRHDKELWEQKHQGEGKREKRRDRSR